MKNILKITILSLLIFLCTGCASVDYTMTINKDNSASLEYLMKIDDADINIDIYSELLDTIIKELEANDFIVEKNENEIRAEKQIDDILELDEFDSLIKANDANIVKKSEGTFTTEYFFDAKIDLTGYSQTTKELKFDELIKENVEIRFNLNLPVKSKSSNSNIEKGKNLTWTLNYGEENFIETNYSLINKEIVLIPIFTVIIFIIILFIINKRNENETIKF